MLVELLSADRINALGIAATSILGLWLGRNSLTLKRVQEELAAVKKAHAQDRENWDIERKSNRAFVRTAVRYIRAQGVHIATLCGLLRQHAPQVEIPTEPTMPDELNDWV